MAPDIVHTLVVVALQVQPVVVVVVVVVVDQILVLVSSEKKVGVVMGQVAVAMELAQEKAAIKMENAMEVAMKMENTMETPFQIHHIHHGQIPHHQIPPHQIPFSFSRLFHYCIDACIQQPMQLPFLCLSEFVSPVLPLQHDNYQSVPWSCCYPVVPTE
jgi:hypothetical protein